MRSIFTLSVLSMLVSSCVSKKDPITGLRCMTDYQAQWKLDSYRERFLATSPDEIKESDTWILIKDGCWKRQYKIGAFHTIIFFDSFTGGLNGIYANSPFRMAPKQCLNQAINDLKALGWPFTERFIAKAKKRYGRRWQDPQIGAASFVDCRGQKSQSVNYYRSLGTFVHEINHLISFKFLYFPEVDKKIHGLKEKGSLAALESLKPRGGLPPGRGDAFLSTQANYLYNAKTSENSSILIGELEAYRLETEIKIQTLKKRGQRGVLSKRGYLSTDFPFFALYDLVRRYHQQRRKKRVTYLSSEESLVILDLLEKSRATIEKLFLQYDKAGMSSMPIILRQRESWNWINSKKDTV